VPEFEAITPILWCVAPTKENEREEFFGVKASLKTGTAAVKTATNATNNERIVPLNPSL
jgi:hypothetical protein